MAKPNNYAGTRMVPSERSFRDIDQEKLRKAFFRTQTQSDYVGKVPSEEAVGENFGAIHQIGQRTTKYMDFQQKRAPLTNRLACRYTQAYQPLPLGDHEANRALAQSYKEGFGTSKGPNPCPLDGTTVYDDVFVAVSTRDLRRARQEPAKPPMELTHTVCPPGDLLEKESVFHEHFKTPYAGLKSESVKPPVACHHIGGAPRYVLPLSSTRRMHNVDAVRVTRNHSTPTLGLTPLPPLDPEVLMRPRLSYMEPGK